MTIFTRPLPQWLVTFLTRSWFPVGLLTLIILKLELVYFGFRYANMVAPPGDDAAVHLHIIDQILTTGSLLGQNYPPLFHLLVIGAAQLLESTPLVILTYGTPLLIVLSGLAVTYLAWTLQGKTTAWITASLYILPSAQATFNYGQGSYPQILGGAIILPLFIAFLLRYLHRPNRLDALLAGILVVLVVATHHFTAAYTWFIGLVWLLILLFTMRNKSGRFAGLTRRWVVWSIFILLLGMILALTQTTIIQTLLSAQIQGFAGDILGSPLFIRPLDHLEYPRLLGPVIWYLGIIATGWLMVTNSIRAEVKLLLICWIAGLFLLSRWPLVVFPERFGRELTIPLVLASSLMIRELLNRLVERWQQIAVWGMLGFLLVFHTNQVFTDPLLPNSFAWAETFSRGNLETAQALKELIKPDEILLMNPSLSYWNRFSGLSLYQLTPLETQTDKTLAVTVERLNAAYLLIIPLPPSNPSPIQHPYLRDYEKVTQSMRAYPKKELMARFVDGTELYQLVPTE